jgi:peptidoglycan hydrolase CwlO-like protein
MPSRDARARNEDDFSFGVPDNLTESTKGNTAVGKILLLSSIAAAGVIAGGLLGYAVGSMTGLPVVSDYAVSLEKALEQANDEKRAAEASVTSLKTDLSLRNNDITKLRKQRDDYQSQITQLEKQLSDVKARKPKNVSKPDLPPKSAE